MKPAFMASRQASEALRLTATDSVRKHIEAFWREYALTTEANRRLLVQTILTPPFDRVVLLVGERTPLIISARELREHRKECDELGQCIGHDLELVEVGQ